MFGLRTAFYLSLLLAGALFASCSGPPRGSGIVGTEAGRGFLLLGYLDKDALLRALGPGVRVHFLGELAVARAKLFVSEAARLRERGLIRFWEPDGAERANDMPSNLLRPASEEDWQWHLSATHVRELWTHTLGTGLSVAVLDTGIDATHPDLAGTLLEGFDASTGEPLRPGTDFSQGRLHGTHVVGLLAAHGRVFGMAPEGKVLPVRVFGPSYAGDFAVASAIILATRRGARVINMSFSGASYSYTLHAALNYAMRQGVIAVAAAGNWGQLKMSYPAGYPGVVAVGSSGPEGVPSWFSAQGEWISVYAPGEELFSTLPGASYGFLSGTSMAAPVVSGLGLLLKSLRVSLDGYGFAWLLRHYGVDARALLDHLTEAPVGGCAGVRLLKDGQPLQAWIRLEYENGLRYIGKSDLLGEARFVNVPLGDAKLYVMYDVAGSPRVFSTVFQIYRTCSWETVVNVPTY